MRPAPEVKHYIEQHVPRSLGLVYCMDVYDNFRPLILL